MEKQYCMRSEENLLQTLPSSPSLGDTATKTSTEDNAFLLSPPSILMSELSYYSLLVKGLYSLFMCLSFALYKVLCLCEALVHKMVSVCGQKPASFSTSH